MEHRNRAQGWKYAKLSGHENEELVKELFSDTGNFQTEFLNRIGKGDCTIVDINVGGLKEKNVTSVLGGTTKSKTDLRITLSDGTLLKISIKKSLAGQVYLIPIEHFIKGFELQYNEIIPDDVKRAITLYWGSAVDTLDIIEKFGTFKSYEKHKHRVVADTIYQYNTQLYVKLLDWFKHHTYELFDFCFSKGLANNEEDWANVVWYINKLGENSVDELFLIDDLANYFDEEAHNDTFYGSVNGGSTIQLPFGFVQWHSPTKTIPGCLQFHHNYEKLTKSKKKKND